MNNKNKKSFLSMSLPHSKKILLSATLVLLFSTASFADWQINPVVKVGAEVDDNASLSTRTDEELELNGYLLDAGVDFGYASERTTFNVLPRVLLRRYPDNSEFDFTDLFLRSRFNHQMRSSSIGFRVNFDEQQVRTAERADVDLDAEDADEITEDDSGRVGLSGNRSKWRIMPNWRYNFSRVSSIEAELIYFDVRYEDVFAGLLTDYNDARLNLSYRRAFSNRNTLVATLTGRLFSADDPSIEDVSGAGVLGGFESDLSETTRLRAMIGVESTEQTVGQRDPEVIGNVTLTRRLETILMFAQYRRTVSASGAGRASLRDQVNINFTRSLSERITAGLGIRAYQSKGLGDSVSIDDRDYIQLRTQFIWHLSPALSIEADYRYTILDRGTVLGDRANSNHISLWLAYQPNLVDR